MLGAPTLQVKQAVAPSGLRGPALARCGVHRRRRSDPEVFAHCLRALKPGGRLVINAVALETEQCVLGWYLEHGGELRRFSIEVATRLGGMNGFRPAMTVTQWRLAKP